MHKPMLRKTKNVVEDVVRNVDAEIWLCGGFTPQICSHAFRVVCHSSYRRVDLPFLLWMTNLDVLRSRLEATIRGLPLRCAMSGFRCRRCYGDAHLNVRNMPSSPSLETTEVGLWKKQQAGPDDDSRMFLGELGAVVVAVAVEKNEQNQKKQKNEKKNRKLKKGHQKGTSRDGSKKLFLL